MICSAEMLAAISEAPIANVVDTNYSSVTKVDKRLLPAAAAFGGVHQEMRSAAGAFGTITY